MCALLALQLQASDLALGAGEKVSLHDSLKRRQYLSDHKVFKQFVQREYDLYDCESAIMYTFSYLTKQKCMKASFSEAFLAQNSVQKYIAVRAKMADSAANFYTECSVLCEKGKKISRTLDSYYRDFCDKCAFDREEMSRQDLASYSTVEAALTGLCAKIKEHQRLQAEQQADYWVTKMLLYNKALFSLMVDEIDYYTTTQIHYEQQMHERVRLMKKFYDSCSVFLQEEQDVCAPDVGQAQGKGKRSPRHLSFLSKVKTLLRLMANCYSDVFLCCTCIDKTLKE